MLLSKGGNIAMKLIAEKDDGTQIEIKEIGNVPKSCSMLLFTTSYMLSKSDQKAFEDCLTKRTGKKCILLPNCIDKIYGMD